VNRQILHTDENGELLIPWEMLDRIGVVEVAEINLEPGRIVISVPLTRESGRRMGFEEAKQSAFAKYDSTLRRLADAGEAD
jgi:hypothetical protein